MGRTTGRETQRGPKRPASRGVLKEKVPPSQTFKTLAALKFVRVILFCGDWRCDWVAILDNVNPKQFYWLAGRDLNFMGHVWRHLDHAAGIQGQNRLAFDDESAYAY